MTDLKLRFKEGNYVGKLMILIGVLILIPIIVIPFYPQDAKYLFDFLLPGTIAILSGFIVCLFYKKNEDCTHVQSNLQYGSITIIFIWAFGVLMGALPFIISGQLRFTQALFEAVSGWTTTGLSVLDVTTTAQIYLFHRSFMQFCGGLGFVMMMILLVHGKQTMNLYSAEGHPDKIYPNLKKTARVIFTMYMSFMIVGTLLYWFAGMSFFDAINHSMCSLSTGGFSTKLNSIGEYNSLSIEWITILLMIIGTTNFAALLILTKRKWKQFLSISEVKFMFIIFLVSIPLIAISLALQMNLSWLDALRHATFNAVSALSTTGYATMNFATWPQFSITILILLMFIGGGIGSTAGGLKISRFYLMIRISWMNLKRKIVPSRTINVETYIKPQGKSQIDQTTIMDTVSFFFWYTVIYVVGSLLVTLTANTSLIEGMFEFASALGTVGLSIGITTMTTNNATLIVEMLGMLFGRLEIFIILIGLYSSFTAIKNKFIRVK